MARGGQLHEAGEVALPMFVPLKPEPKARLAPWERKELAESERRYRKRRFVQQPGPAGCGLTRRPRARNVYPL